MARKEYDEKKKLRDDEYKEDLDVLKKMQGEKDRNYKSELAHLNSLIEKYKESGEIQIDIAKKVSEYKESLLKRAKDLDEEYANALKAQAKSVFDSFGVFDMIKIDLPAELRKLDDKAKTSSETRKNLTETMLDEEKNLNRISRATDNLNSLEDKRNELINQRNEIYIQYLEADTAEEQAIQGEKLKQIDKDLADLKKETKAATDELNKSEAEAKKNREAITKNTQTLIDQYPELLQYLDSETGRLNLTDAELRKLIRSYQLLEEEKMKTKKKDDFFADMDKNIKDGKEYLKSIGMLDEKLKEFGDEKNARAIEEIFKKFNQAGVGSLDDLAEILKFSDEEMKKFIDNTGELLEISDKTAENQLKGKKEKLDKELKDIKDIISETDVSEPAAELGVNIVEGIIEGIQSGAGNLAEAIKNMILSGLAAGEKVAEIASPSKLFRDRIGKNIALGIGAGIDDEMPDVIDDMRNYANMIAGAASRTINYGGGGKSSGSGDTTVLQELMGAMKNQGSQTAATPEIHITIAPTGDTRGFWEAASMNIKRVEYLNGGEKA